MAEPFVGEIRILPYTFAPQGWARCEGQIMPIRQNETLYAVIGPSFGGDGRNTFKLPDLLGRSPMHSGDGPGLTPRNFATTSGDATVTLTEPQMPSHTHTAQASMELSTESVPTNNSYPALMIHKTGGADQAVIFGYRTPDEHTLHMASQALVSTGQSLGHENRQPCLGLYFCIALEGLFPERN